MMMSTLATLVTSGSSMKAVNTLQQTSDTQKVMRDLGSKPQCMVNQVSHRKAPR
jgi:hypothetical protein